MRVRRRSLLRRPQGAEIDGRVARAPAGEKPLDRRVEHDLVELPQCEQPVPADGRVGRGDRLERPAPEVAREDDVDDVLRGELRSGAIESTIAIGPSNGSASSMPDLLRELAAQRVDERLARVRPRRRAAASTPCPASRAGRAGCGRASAGARRRGCAARRSRARRAEAARAALAAGQLVHLDAAPTAGHRHDDELGDPHPRLDDERLVAVGVEQDHPQLAAVARIDEPGRVHDRDARASPRGPSAAATKPAWPSGIATAMPVPTIARSPGPSSSCSQATRSRPASPGYARVGQDRVVAQPRDRRARSRGRRALPLVVPRRGTGETANVARGQAGADQYAVLAVLARLDRRAERVELRELRALRRTARAADRLEPVGEPLGDPGAQLVEPLTRRAPRSAARPGSGSRAAAGRAGRRASTLFSTSSTGSSAAPISSSTGVDRRASARRACPPAPTRRRRAGRGPRRASPRASPRSPRPAGAAGGG